MIASTIRARATRYISEGFAVVPIPYKSKGPVDPGWESNTYLPSDFSRGRSNIGIKLGAASGGLVCVDLDDPVAISLAPKYLPKTDMIAGRSQAQNSHWFYKVDREFRKREFKHRPTKQKLIEILGDGQQVVCGPSVHPADDTYDDLSGKPSSVDAVELVDSVGRLFEAVCDEKGLDPYAGVPLDRAKLAAGDTCRPGDDFNERGDVRALLISSGWSPGRTSHNREYWTRPGKSAGVSGTLTDGRIFYVFSSSTGLDSDRGYGPFSLYAHLKHDGDFPAAGRELRRLGFGATDSNNATPIGLKLTRISDVEPQNVQWLWRGIIPVGKTTLISGDPGLGKSYITLFVAARVTRGDSWPNDETRTQSGSVILFAAEDDIADTIRPRLDAAGADVSRIYCIEGMSQFDSKLKRTVTWTFRLDRDLPFLEAKLKELKDANDPVRLVVIDPISCYLGKTDSHNNAEVRGTLAPLAELASRYQVAIVLVSHLNKSGTGKAVYRSSGSLAFAAAARSVWAVIRDLDNPERRLMLPVKMNLCKEPAGLAYSIIDDRVSWEAEPVAMTADEFLVEEHDREKAPSRQDENSAFSRAVTWLSQALSDGRAPSKSIDSDAQAHGISKATLRRAFNHLGGVATKDGDRWYWSLPPAQQK